MGVKLHDLYYMFTRKCKKLLKLGGSNDGLNFEMSQFILVNWKIISRQKVPWNDRQRLKNDIHISITKDSLKFTSCTAMKN